MNGVHDSFLKPRVLEHFPVHRALFIIADALERNAAGCKRRVDWFGLHRNDAALFDFRRCLRLRAATTAATASPATTCAGFLWLFSYFFGGNRRRVEFTQRFCAFVRRF